MERMNYHEQNLWKELSWTKIIDYLKTFSEDHIGRMRKKLHLDIFRRSHW